MSYGWATVFTLAAWFAGLVIDVRKTFSHYEAVTL